MQTGHDGADKSSLRCIYTKVKHLIITFAELSGNFKEAFVIELLFLESTYNSGMKATMACAIKRQMSESGGFSYSKIFDLNNLLMDVVSEFAA